MVGSGRRGRGWTSWKAKRKTENRTGTEHKTWNVCANETKLLSCSSFSPLTRALSVGLFRPQLEFWLERSCCSWDPIGVHCRKTMAMFFIWAIKHSLFQLNTYCSLDMEILWIFLHWTQSTFLPVLLCICVGMFVLFPIWYPLKRFHIRRLSAAPDPVTE